jgi:RNA recognition motif-containing protein
MKQFVFLIILIVGFGVTSAAWAGSKLFVGGLSFGATSTEVNRLVKNYGTVLSIKVKSIDDNGDMSAKAEVDFESDEAAGSAAAALDGLNYQGEPLSTKSKPKEIVVVGSKVKEVTREAGLRSDGELVHKSKPKEIVVVGSKVKEVIREAGLRSDGKFVQALSDKVYRIIKTAIKSAKSNKRGTVRPHDL